MKTHYEDLLANLYGATEEDQAGDHFAWLRPTPEAGEPAPLAPGYTNRSYDGGYYTEWGPAGLRGGPATPQTPGDMVNEIMLGRQPYEDSGRVQDLGGGRKQIDRGSQRTTWDASGVRGGPALDTPGAAVDVVGDRSTTRGLPWAADSAPAVIAGAPPPAEQLHAQAALTAAYRGANERYGVPAGAAALPADARERPGPIEDPGAAPYGVPAGARTLPQDARMDPGAAPGTAPPGQNLYSQDIMSGNARKFGGRSAAGAHLAPPSSELNAILMKRNAGQPLSDKEWLRLAQRGWVEDQFGISSKATGGKPTPYSADYDAEKSEKDQEQKKAEAEQVKGFKSYVDAHPELKKSLGVKSWDDLSPNQILGLNKAMQADLDFVRRRAQEEGLKPKPEFTPSSGEVDVPGMGKVPYIRQNSGQVTLFPNKPLPAPPKIGHQIPMPDGGYLYFAGAVDEKGNPHYNYAPPRSENGNPFANTTTLFGGGRAPAPAPPAGLPANQASTTPPPAAATGKLYTPNPAGGRPALNPAASPLQAINQAFQDGLLTEAEARTWIEELRYPAKTK